jgi:hypothetical protein
VIVLWVTLSLDVPVFDGANDVRLVRLAELDLDLVPLVRFGVLEKQVETPCPRLRSFPVLQNQIPKPEERGIFADAVLKAIARPVPDGP